MFTRGQNHRCGYKHAARPTTTTLAAAATTTVTTEAEAAVTEAAAATTEAAEATTEAASSSEVYSIQRLHHSQHLTICIIVRSLQQRSTGPIFDSRSIRQLQGLVAAELGIATQCGMR